VVGDGDGNRKPVGRRRVSRRPPAAAAQGGRFRGGAAAGWEVGLIFLDPFFVDL
jgi:hypothetical protein